MDEGAQGRNPFAELKGLLKSVAGLSGNEAAIYALGLERGVITTRDVTEATVLRQTTAGGILKRLTGRGFFTVTVGHEGAKGGRGRGQKFRAVNPRRVLKSTLEGFTRFEDLLGVVDEHMDVLEAEEGVDEEVWRITPEALENHFCGALASASSSVEISSNDCSWVALDGVLDALHEAHKRGAKVEVLTAQVADRERKKLEANDIAPRVVENSGQPFALIDKSVLYLAIRSGQLSIRYGALYTKNPYLVANFRSTFDNRKIEGNGGGP